MHLVPPFSLFLSRTPATGSAVFQRAKTRAVELPAILPGKLWRRGFAIAATIPTLALAQHDHGAMADPTNEPIVLGRMVVAGAATGGTSAFESDASRLLANTPGVEFYSAGGVSSLPVLHGLADDRLRIQVNGMSLISACANHMNPPLSYIAPSNVGSITVYPSLVPVSIGGDSIGGAIVVDPPPLVFADAAGPTVMKGEAGGFFRSNGNVVGGHLASTLATAAFSLAYRGSLTKGGDYQAAKTFKAPTVVTGTRVGDLPIDGRTVGSTAFEAGNHSLRAAAQGKNQSLELDLGYQFIPFQGFPNQRMDMTLNRSEQATLRYRAETESVRLEGRTYFEHTRHKMDFLGAKQYWYGSAATILAPGMPMNTEGTNVGGYAKAVVPLNARDELGAGVEVQRYRLDDWWPPSPSVLPPGYTTGGMAPDTFWNINNGQRDRYGLFAEWNARWSDQLQSTVGLRHETVVMNTGVVQGYNNTPMYNGAPLYPATRFNAADRRRSDQNWDALAQLRYEPSPSWSYEVGYALKTRSPNLYERYAWSTNTMAMEMVNFAGDGNFYVGDLDLKSETAHTVAITVQAHDRDRKEWAVSVAPYFTYVVDYVDARRLPSSVGGASATVIANQSLTRDFVYLQYANKTAQLYGFDAQAHFPLSAESRYGALHAVAEVSYTRGRNLSDDDGLYNIPPFSTKLAVVHQFERWTTTLEAQNFAAKTKVSAIRNEVRTGGYALFNLRVAYRWSRFRVEAGVENLLNRFYTLPLGGAYLGQGPTMSGRAIPWGVGIPGPGRSTYAALTVTF